MITKGKLEKITSELWNKYASQDYNCNVTITDHKFDYLVEELVEKLTIHGVVGSETKLLCVNVLDTTWLTLGKKYTLIDEEEENYLVEGNVGLKNWYRKNRFKVLETQ